MKELGELRREFHRMRKQMVWQEERANEAEDKLAEAEKAREERADAVRTIHEIRKQEKSRADSAEAREAAWVEHFKDNSRCERHGAEGCECDGTILEPLDTSPRAEAILKVTKRAEDEYLIHQFQVGAGGCSGCDCPFCDAVRELKETEGAS